VHRFESPLTRREVLKRGGTAAFGLSALAATDVALARSALGAGSARIPLPSAHQVRKDFQRMVDFGPRLTGSASHSRYVAWLEREFVKAGLRLAPCDVSRRFAGRHTGSGSMSSRDLRPVP
jgi:hypothetical protein